MSNAQSTPKTEKLSTIFNFCKNFSNLKVLSLLGLITTSASAEELISYSHTAASTTPDAIHSALTSSASLGGSIAGATIVTSIDQISANQNDGLGGGSSASPSPTNVDWFSYSVASTDSNILFETVDLTVFSGSRGPTLYDLTYLDGAGVEHDLALNVNLNTAGTESFSLPTPTNDVTEFRVYVYGRTITNNGASRVSIDDFIVSGSTGSGSSLVVLPHIGQAELQYLQDENDGDILGASVRQLRVDSGTYSAGAVVPIGAYADGTVHRLVVNTTASDSASLLEFSIAKDGDSLDLINYYQTGEDKISILNAGLGSLPDSLELALELPSDLGGVTVTHYTSSLDTWADTQYGDSHFAALGDSAVVSVKPKGDISMGVYGE